MFFLLLLLFLSCFFLYRPINKQSTTFHLHHLSILHLHHLHLLTKNDHLLSLSPFSLRHLSYHHNHLQTTHIQTTYLPNYQCPQALPRTTFPYVTPFAIFTFITTIRASHRLTSPRHHHINDHSPPHLHCSYPPHLPLITTPFHLHLYVHKQVIHHLVRPRHHHANYRSPPLSPLQTLLYLPPIFTTFAILSITFTCFLYEFFTASSGHVTPLKMTHHLLLFPPALSSLIAYLSPLLLPLLKVYKAVHYHITAKT